jgi:flagellar P-ring protein precursor FlgI
MRLQATLRAARRLASVFTVIASVGVASLVPSAPAWAAPHDGESVRIKDLGRVKGWRQNVLVGYGIVTGLAGTGDSSGNAATKQALSNALSQFNLAVPAAQIQSRNVAVVMISAELPSFAREGDTLDVTVTSAGDARSLVGGSLLVAPLRAPDGRVYALAEGPLAVGGYRYDANGNVVQKNHPTVGSVPNGARVEVDVHAEIPATQSSLTFVLNDPDYTTANRLAAAINQRLGAALANARDAEGVDIAIPADQRSQLVAFISRIEGVEIQPDQRARVVINERTGTVVSGGDVRISPVAISQGDLKIAITSTNSVSQPSGIIGGSAGIRTAIVTNTTVDVGEPQGPGYVAPGSTTVADLVQSLSRLKANTRDVISILRAVKAAGALHAELVVQ